MMKNNNLVGEIKAIYLPAKFPKVRVSDSEKVVKFIRNFWEDLNYYESFYVLHLNPANETIGWTKISEGGITGTDVDPKRIFHAVLSTSTPSIILAHNHPSGNLMASTADRNITQRIKGGCELLGINLLDHIILTEESYYSFADNGIL